MIGRGDAKVPLDCRTCGLCCISLQDQPVYVDCTEQDVDRLPKRFRRLHVVQDDAFTTLSKAIDGAAGGWCIKTVWRESRSGPLKGTRSCQCAALSGSLLHKVRCTVYEDRPDVCRQAIQPGDRECVDLRRRVSEAIAEEKSK